MLKFNDAYNKFMKESTRREYLTLGEVEQVFDDVLKSLGVYISIMGPEYGPIPMTFDVTARFGDIKKETVRAYKAGVHPMYRQDLLKDGYGLLVNILDEADMWRKGTSDSVSRNRNVPGSEYKVSPPIPQPEM
jgi:hypothetical protein